jgi:diguanylate cyclase (GGDEF)-like protein
VEEARRPWLGNPLSWRLADRCLAIALLMIAATSIVLVATLLGGWPFLNFDTSATPRLPAGQSIGVATWTVLAFASWRARGGDRGGLALAVLTVALYTLTLASFTLMTGPFANPGWLGFLGGSVVGYVLFPRWISLGGIALYAVLVITCSAILGAGHVPTSILPRALYDGLDAGTIVRRSVASLSLFALTFAVIAFIVDRWRAREAGYQRLASTDALTGLTNRRRFMEVASGELSRSRRYGLTMSLILVDLDHFKVINDQHGHAIGDQALSHAARVLSSSLRDVDLIARYGGEEFAMLLPMTDARGAAEVAERCTRRLSDTPLLVDGITIHVTASMGVAACSGGTCGDLDKLLRVADAALYRAKEGGRDRVEMAVW